MAQVRKKTPSIRTIAGSWVRSAERCWKCGAHRDLERAHLRSRSKGGSDSDPRNYQLICHDCHRAQPKEFASRDEALAWINDGRSGDESVGALLVDEFITNEGVPPSELDPVVMRRMADWVWANSRTATDGKIAVRLKAAADRVEEIQR